MLLGLHVKEM
jgi:hypothetical protein